MNIRTINPHCTAVYESAPSGCGIRTTVFSYDTKVFTLDEENKPHRHWSGWSVTTQRDINSVANIGMTKRVWEAMPVEY